MSQPESIPQRQANFVSALDQIVDLGIASVLFIAPLAMAGRYPPGRLILAILVGITAVASLLSKALTGNRSSRFLWTGGEWLACLALLIVVLQLIPLPAKTLQFLSPSTGALLPLHAQAEPGPSSADSASPIFAQWGSASLAPHATRGGLAMLIVYVLLFFVVAQRVRTRHDVERLLKSIAVAGIAMATLGLVQFLFGNGKFLWVLEHPSRDTLTAVKGTFANENHFSHFLALTLGPLLFWLVKEYRGAERNANAGFTFGTLGRRDALPMKQVLLGLGLAIVLLAGLLTYSRGGLVMMALSAAVTTGVLLYQGQVGKRMVWAVSAAVAFAALAIWIHGQEILARELSTLENASISSLDKGHGRRKIWSAVLEAVPDFAMLGSGVGSHRYIYPTYFRSESSVQYTHAESGYLHILLETGGPGFAALLLGIGISGYWIFWSLRSSDERTALLAVPLLACWLVSVVHAVFDFNWFIPANMCLTLVVVALASRLWSMNEGSSTGSVSVSTFGWYSAAAFTTVMSLFSVAYYIAPARAHSSWNEYRAWSLATNRFEEKSIGNGRQRSLGFVDGTDPTTVAHMIDLLDTTVRRDPNDGRAHVRMAAMCLRQFELLQDRSDSGMTLAQIRDAAQSAGFESHTEMNEWVTRVVGDRRGYLDRILWHSKQGIRSTPTEGLGYLYLSEVAFLDESLAGTEHSLLSQAYVVRPYDPGVQFLYGRQRLLMGDVDAAMELWKSAFRSGQTIRGRIISAVAFHAPPQEILDVFQPDLAGLRDLFEYYRARELPEQLAIVGQRYASELEQRASLMAGRPAGELWYDAQGVHQAIGNVEESADAAKKAVLAQPGEYKNHFACALRMRDAGRLEDAVREFKWCASRKPDDTTLPRVVAQIQREIRQSTALNAPVRRTGRVSR